MDRWDGCVCVCVYVVEEGWVSVNENVPGKGLGALWLYGQMIVEEGRRSVCVCVWCVVVEGAVAGNRSKPPLLMHQPPQGVGEGSVL